MHIKPQRKILLNTHLFIDAISIARSQKYCMKLNLGYTSKIYTIVKKDKGL